MSLRLFQNSGVMRNYLSTINASRSREKPYKDLVRDFLNDRFGAAHILAPVLQGDPSAFFTNADDETLQRAWARENGLKYDVSLEDILLAQIEYHKTEVFYNLDPGRYPGVARKLPASVKVKIAWRAAPGKIDFAGYDLVVCNFPSILASYKAEGLNSKYFFPGHDPELDLYGLEEARGNDVTFIGGYSRHHLKRGAVLDAVARLRNEIMIDFRLDISPMTALAETPLGVIGPLKSLRRPEDIRAVSRSAVFGRDLYLMLSKTKIVLNGAVDMAGPDRGNMRCWEATGAGALLLSDEGNYPEGFENGQNMLTYKSPDDAVRIIEACLDGSIDAAQIAAAGRAMIRARYSKENQWRAFLALL